ncbi:TetR/AcrR family transcriptional regulator C-terminal domain-containing protein [Streptomyces sp. 110]|uniref:TetR/AcrR family transcriptional regulator C-terminal domain-containing protein n=1 Tax=Streptomyces endocoffeicus TaxID=2898945 RepID=A0ABS1PEW0_9ACTN|nr:TetR/AcrR family transcriptional regulator C-terminal domain-containing protein [Streptomyces endocoffeicus]
MYTGSVTNAQGEAPRAAGLTPRDVVRAALEVLDERGINAVSTRAVADRLGVRMNTVLWHTKTKARLLDLMADAIIGEVPLDGIEGDWRDQARELMRRLRQAILSHRDGALVVSGTFPAEPHTLGFADRLLSFLLNGSTDTRKAAWTAWSLFYFALGLAQEEQSTPQFLYDQLTPRVSADIYPTLSRVLDEFTAPDFDDRFEHGVLTMLSALDS